MKQKACMCCEECEAIVCCKTTIDKLKLSLSQENKLSDIVKYSKIMSDKTRASIMYLLFIKESLCVCDFTNILDMSSQAISSQLVKLRDQGILQKEKIGLTVFYSIENNEFKEYLNHILIK